MHIKLSTILLAILLSLPSVVPAADYEAALSALETGDYRRAYKGFKRLARDYHREAQYQLGMLYLYGKGVDKDVQQGLEWLKASAEAGFYQAAADLGQIYVAGDGVEPNELEAIKWLELADKLAEESDDAEECE